jgi:hypothetical protein
MAKTAIQIERFECDSCGKQVDGDVGGQPAEGLHFTVADVDRTGNQTKVEGFACRLSHVKNAVAKLLHKTDEDVDE